MAMASQVDHIEFAIFFVGELELAGLLFTRWMEWRSRLADLGITGVGLGLTVRSMWNLGWVLFLAVTMRGVSPPVFGRVNYLGLAVFLITAAALFVLNRLDSRGEQQLQAHEVTRGVLKNRVEALASLGQTEWTLRPRTFDLYVVPEGFRMWRLTQDGRKILLLRKLIERLSRTEIDALIARQITRQGKNYWLPSAVVILVGGAAAIGLLEWLNLGFHDRWLVLLLLLAVEITSLTLYSPWAAYRADLDAIALIGTPDPLISATAEIARLHGSKLEIAPLERFVRATRITASRLQNLINEQRRSAEDRYAIEE